MLTIDQSVQLLALFLFVGLLLAILIGWRQIQSARGLPYFLLRRERLVHGWRLIFLGFAFGLAGVFMQLFGRQAAYVIVPPTPSITPTATITQTQTITLTSTITHTPTITRTPTITPTSTETATPMLPEALAPMLIRETITPNPEGAFSQIEIATHLDGLNRPLDAAESFENPLERLYGAFTYNNLQDGVRWTAIWYRGGEEVCIETQAWNGGTGGYGYTECHPEQWLPGEYEIRMFLGEQWKISARFVVVGAPPAPSSTPSQTPPVTSTTTP